MGVSFPKMKLGFVPANRGFFSAELAAKMRRLTIDVMAKLGVEVVVPNEQETKVGCVENLKEAEACAELFRRNDVKGIVIGAVNFGDEQAAAWVVRRAGLGVPVLIFGCQEEETLTLTTPRRDAFCGLISIGDALRQIGVPYTTARRPICFPSDASFHRELDQFIRVCRVVNGLKKARYGQVGARPEAFWTCRFDERQLQWVGPTTVVMDLSEAVTGVNEINENDAAVQRILEEINRYADTSAVDAGALLKMARFETFLRRWRQEQNLDAVAVQCWTSIQQNLGLCPCTVMSRLGEDGIPCACEADILGAMSMHACLLASGSPAGLADWNNLHNEDGELVNLWHCSSFPRSFSRDRPKITYNRVLVSSGATRRENSDGAVEMLFRESPLTLARVTQATDGTWKALVAQGRVEDNPAATFGGYGWCRVRNLDRLYRDVLLQHFPHHVAITQNHVGNVLWEAFGNYLGFKVYHATQHVPGLYNSLAPFPETAGEPLSI